MAKTATWTHIVKDLPRFTEDPKYQDKVNAAKDELRRRPGFRPFAAGLALEYEMLRMEKDRAKVQLYNINVYIKAVEQLMTDQYDLEGVTSIRLEDGCLVICSLQPHAKVSNKDENREWAVSSGLERQLSLPWGTNNSYMKNELMLGHPEQPGVMATCRAVISARGRQKGIEGYEDVISSDDNE